MTKELYNDFYKRHGITTHGSIDRFQAIADLCKDKVLDVGCGTGDLSDFYKGDYFGIDISSVAINMAKKTRRADATFLTLDATKPISEPLQNFDTIVMGEFLEHIKDDTEVFKNIQKWTQPNARLIISVPNGDRVPDKNHLREFTVPVLRARFSKLGLVKFHRWIGFEKRLLMTVDLGQKKENTIALSMIVKNEGKGLEDAVLSCIEFIDHISIAVDNSSEDKSDKIAQRYADTFKYFDWDDDFAIARNYAQEEITTKWILVIDGHELVEKYEGLEEALKADVDGLMVKVNMENSDSFYTNRIYRSYLKWIHPIHNLIPMKTSKKYNGLTVKHDISNGQSKKSRQIRTKQRDEMMIRRLKEELKNNKKSTRAIFYLARWYFTKGQAKKAIPLFKKYLKKSTIKGEKWYCCWEASICANALRKPLLALKFLKKADEFVPNRWEISKQKGLSYMNFEHWDKAIECLTDSFKENPGDFSHYPEKRNLPETWDQIGFCFYQLGKYQQAKIAWERSIETDKECARMKLNKKRIELIDRNLII